VTSFSNVPLAHGKGHSVIRQTLDDLVLEAGIHQHFFDTLLVKNGVDRSETCLLDLMDGTFFSF